MSGVDVKILESPVKSLNDKRDYRVIQLPNGFTAILISDQSSSEGEEASGKHEEVLGSDESDMEDDFSDDGEDEDEEEDEDDDDDDSGDDEEEDGEVGKSNKKGKSKSQGEKLSAAGLCVGTGSFSDPTDIPGFSHFLEHMVFMGSEKYPDENAFDAFVKKNGGGTNAFTGCERTVFYFDIKKNLFAEGLDRFAQFFIHPLMKQDSVDREVKAVDSEFDMSRTSDASRKEQLIGSLAREGHPMGKFMWGNTDSLKETPAKEGIDVYGRLHEYRRRMYSSHYMTLAVQSRDTLDNLQSLVTEIFQHVPNNGLPRPEFCDKKLFTGPFDTAAFRKSYKVVPIKDKEAVELTWDLPSQKKTFREKPLHYLGWILGHEGKGSFLSYLKEKLWASTVFSGNSESSFEQNDTWSVFSVEISLTAEGFKHVDEVVEVLFSYLGMMKKCGSQQRIYDEIKTVEDNSFRWQEQVEPYEYVETVCENMQLYPPGEYLTGDRLLAEYDPQLIELCTSFLVPNKANVYLKSKSLEAEFTETNTKIEPWYQTKYITEDLPKNWLDRWESPREINELHLPAKNEYIATDFTVKEPEIPVPPMPALIREDDGSKLWYKPDIQFKVPKAYARFCITCPVINESPKSLCIFDLYSKVITHKLDEIAYDADVASLYYALSGSESDVIIKVSGYNQKLHKLFETVVDQVANFELSEDLFNTLKLKLKKSLYNQYTKPGNLGKDVRLGMLQQPYWGSVPQQAALTSVTRDDVINFSKRVYDGSFVHGLVQGNMSSLEAKTMLEYLINKLKITPPSRPLPEVCCLKVPEGSRFCRVANLNPTDCNSVLTNYYQWGQANLHQSVLMELHMLHMDEPVFDILRTREQLGYSVFSTFRNTSGIMGFSITVCSQATKFNMEQLDKKVEDFLIEFKEKHIDPLTETEFNALVNSMVTLKKCEDSNLREEVERNWGEINNRTFAFDRLTKEISDLENLGLEEFKDFFGKLVPTNGTIRKLSVQIVGTSQGADVVGSGDVISETTQINIPKTTVPDFSYGDVALVFVPVEDEIQQNSITNIDLFKQQNVHYPPSKIL